MDGQVSAAMPDGAQHTAPPAWLAKPLKVLDWLEETAASLLLVLVLLTVFMQVVARYLFAAPFYWGDELARYAYVWLAFLGGACIMGRRGHIGIGVIDTMVSPRVLKLLECLALLIIAGTCLALVWFSYPWLLRTARPTSSALRMPMIFLYGGVWTCFALMAFHSLIHFVLVATGRAPVTPPQPDSYE